MPTYEYQCDNCKKHFTTVESIERHGRAKPACPKCKSKKVTQVFRSFFVKTSKKS